MLLVTTSANEVLAPIHDRMPVIVRKEDWEQWP
jgi:putative SOS response-associated peptidase YedK